MPKEREKKLQAIRKLEKHKVKNVKKSFLKQISKSNSFLPNAIKLKKTQVFIMHDI